MSVEYVVNSIKEERSGGTFRMAIYIIPLNNVMYITGKVGRIFTT